MTHAEIEAAKVRADAPALADECLRRGEEIERYLALSDAQQPERPRRIDGGLGT